MLNSQKIQKYANLIAKSVTKYRDLYGLDKRILVNLGEDASSLGKELSLVLKDESFDLEYTSPNQDISFLNNSPEAEQVSFFENKTIKLLEKYDTIIKIININQNYNETNLSEKLLEIKRNTYRRYLNKLEELEEAQKFITMRCYFFTELSYNYYRVDPVKLDNILTNALFLDYEDPFTELEKRRSKILEILEKINKLDIKELRIYSDKYQLLLSIDPSSKWVFSKLRNFPSFEIFISPNVHKTKGEYLFNIPTYYNQDIINETLLTFNEGIVTRSSSKDGYETLTEILNIPGGNQVGELGITDKRFSPITEISGCLMFDENISGEFGNFHIALGNSYSRSLGSSILPNNGNKSQIHVDFINTNEFTIEAKLSNNSVITLFKDGVFKI